MAPHLLRYSYSASQHAIWSIMVWLLLLVEPSGDYMSTQGRHPRGMTTNTCVQLAPAGYNEIERRLRNRAATRNP